MNNIKISRPDLTKVEPPVLQYIEMLERELERFKHSAEVSPPGSEPAEIKTDEPPTTLNVITFTSGGLAKRTPRHLYARQRRGGMGVFDLDAPAEDPPRFLVVADESQNLILFTNLARAFRFAVSQITEGEVRDKGQAITSRLQLQAGEHLITGVIDQPQGGVALVSTLGIVRYLRHHVFGEYMRPGASMFDPKKFGNLVAACRTPGDNDLFIATRSGKAIRFSEKLVPPQGGPGIRLETNDSVVAMTSVDSDSGVFLVDSLGRGTIRLMNSFNPNKGAGGGGKIAMNTDLLIAAATVKPDEDIFLISRLSKIIRFMVEEVPAKEGNVQGVNCMALRGDEVISTAVST